MSQPKIIKKKAFQAIGISATTKNEIEMSTEGKIPKLWTDYCQGQITDQIPNKRKQSETLALYSNYESDETGAYTYTIGMPVSSLDTIPENMTSLTIPAQTYAVFTTRKGPVSEVIVETWQDIWKWSKENKRAFTTDFELYDERAMDPNNVQVDIYIALA
ncbi:GyrI-like domain-containing protein [Bacillus pseudomycoides]|uniref:GyrI-like domain-containing protein n=1 Tax=Bacillus pseudomycoides TaxID=64104 RepID=UPI0001A15562|nr:GyrI-like domain-containing protein [Bacillus pseudomycoides]EEM09021.1 DNA-binding protein YobU [Bacillus pseudomycoides]KFN13327.1 gyrI-like small molecule binding domain protein [Bacillus pseudomycoides]MDR4190660.1 AraC family transcriptional regulator [Bacillus pseudomycoides]MED0854798.1 GyrI-like domain-containing protein [Bacillus pseudomycoides]PDZ73262.1 AraC family transcriptional regulator [Bacillus pseudomycoides]